MLQCNVCLGEWVWKFYLHEIDHLWSVHFVWLSLIEFKLSAMFSKRFGSFTKRILIFLFKYYVWTFFGWCNDIMPNFIPVLKLFIRNKMPKPKPFSMPNFDTDQTTFACIHRLDQHSCELMLPIIPIVINVLRLCRLKVFWSFCGSTHFYESILMFDKIFEEKHD